MNVSTPPGTPATDTAAVATPATPAASVRTAADIYDEQFVPALFSRFGPLLCDAAAVGPGDRVLDVGCGTGAAALAAALRVGPAGRVVGLDANPEMLAVARRQPLHVAWREGRAEALPFADASFDAVLSQFAMMFFEDAPGALREMQRVLRPGAFMAVAVCDAVERSPGYAALAALLDRLFGRHVGDAFRAPFALGDERHLRRICGEAGLAGARIERRDGMVCFGSVETLVAAERACVWTLGGLLDDGQFARLRDEAPKTFAPFLDARGRVVFSMPALLVVAQKEGGVRREHASAA